MNNKPGDQTSELTGDEGRPSREGRGSFAQVPSTEDQRVLLQVEFLQMNTTLLIPEDEDFTLNCSVVCMFERHWNVVLRDVYVEVKGQASILQLQSFTRESVTLNRLIIIYTSLL